MAYNANPKASTRYVSTDNVDWIKIPNPNNYELQPLDAKINVDLTYDGKMTMTRACSSDTGGC